MSPYLPNNQFIQALRQRATQIRRQLASESVLNREFNEDSPLLIELQRIKALGNHYRKIVRDSQQ